MTQYTYAQLEQLWNDNGGNPAFAPIAAAIAMAESGGNSIAQDNDSNGTTDRGLWQINSVHGTQSTFDVTGNVKAAIAISNNGTNWNPWVTFQTGAYKRFLNPTAQPATGAIDTGSTQSGIGIPGTGISVSGLVQSGVNALLGMMGLGSVKDMLERAGLIILGFTLVIVGIHILSSGSGSSKPQPITINEEQEGSTEEHTSSSSKKPVSEGKTTSRRRAAVKTGTEDAVEAAAVA